MTDVTVNIQPMLPAWKREAGVARPKHTFRAPRRNGTKEKRQLPIWRVHVHQFANAVAQFQKRMAIANAARAAIAKAMVEQTQAGFTPAHAAVAALGVYRQIKNPTRAITRIIRELEVIERGVGKRRS